jgi:hypothetical protein
MVYVYVRVGSVTVLVVTGPGVMTAGVTVAGVTAAGVTTTGVTTTGVTTTGVGVGTYDVEPLITLAVHFESVQQTSLDNPANL